MFTEGSPSIQISTSNRSGVIGANEYSIRGKYQNIVMFTNIIYQNNYRKRWISKLRMRYLWTCSCYSLFSPVQKWSIISCKSILSLLSNCAPFIISNHEAIPISQLTSERYDQPTSCRYHGIMVAKQQCTTSYQEECLTLECEMCRKSSHLRGYRLCVTSQPGVV